MLDKAYGNSILSKHKVLKSDREKTYIVLMTSFTHKNNKNVLEMDIKRLLHWITQ